MRAGKKERNNERKREKERKMERGFGYALRQQAAGALSATHPVPSLSTACCPPPPPPQRCLPARLPAFLPARRYREQPTLPFNAYGTMAIAREEFEANSGSSQFFWLLKVGRAVQCGGVGWGEAGSH